MQEKDNWGDINPTLGVDQHATWKTPTHNDIRSFLYGYWKEKGWKCNQ